VLSVPFQILSRTWVLLQDIALNGTAPANQHASNAIRNERSDCILAYAMQGSLSTPRGQIADGWAPFRCDECHVSHLVNFLRARHATLVLRPLEEILAGIFILIHEMRRICWRSLKEEGNVVHFRGAIELLEHRAKCFLKCGLIERSSKEGVLKRADGIIRSCHLPCHPGWKLRHASWLCLKVGRSKQNWSLGKPKLHVTQPFCCVMCRAVGRYRLVYSLLLQPDKGRLGEVASGYTAYFTQMSAAASRWGLLLTCICSVKGQHACPFGVRFICIGIGRIEAQEDIQGRSSHMYEYLNIDWMPMLLIFHHF